VTISIGNYLQFSKNAALAPKDPSHAATLDNQVKVATTCISKLVAAQKELAAIRAWVWPQQVFDFESRIYSLCLSLYLSICLFKSTSFNHPPPAPSLLLVHNNDCHRQRRLLLLSLQQSCYHRRRRLLLLVHNNDCHRRRRLLLLSLQQSCYHLRRRLLLLVHNIDCHRRRRLLLLVHNHNNCIAIDGEVESKPITSGTIPTRWARKNTMCLSVRCINIVRDL